MSARTIRLATESDLDAIAACDHVQDGPRVRFRQERVARGHCWVSVHDDQIAGFLAIEPTFFGRDFVSLLVVRAADRRRGIGTALMEHALAICSSPRLFTSTNASNSRMRGLLTKLGFVPSGVVENLDPGDPEHFFVKDVRGVAVTAVEVPAIPPVWREVDDYFEQLVGRDAALEAAVEASRAAGLPEHQVAPNQGKLLMLLAMMQRARRVLEIGTLGGYSTIWLARALPCDGRVVTLEANPKHAAVARANVERAGVSALVEVVEGPAIESLERIAASEAAPFDLVFIDADKASNPAYLEWSLRLARPGAAIVADNVVRNGSVVDGASTDPSVRGIRRFIELCAADPRLVATALQTVGAKGYDGVAIALVQAV